MRLQVACMESNSVHLMIINALQGSKFNTLADRVLLCCLQQTLKARKQTVPLSQAVTCFGISYDRAGYYYLGFILGENCIPPHSLSIQRHRYIYTRLTLAHLHACIRDLL